MIGTPKLKLILQNKVYKMKILELAMQVLFRPKSISSARLFAVVVYLARFASCMVELEGTCHSAGISPPIPTDSSRRSKGDASNLLVSEESASDTSLDEIAAPTLSYSGVRYMVELMRGSKKKTIDQASGRLPEVNNGVVNSTSSALKQEESVADKDAGSSFMGSIGSMAKWIICKGKSSCGAAYSLVLPAVVQQKYITEDVGNNEDGSEVESCRSETTLEGYKDEVDVNNNSVGGSNNDLSVNISSLDTAGASIIPINNSIPNPAQADQDALPGQEAQGADTEEYKSVNEDDLNVKNKEMDIRNKDISVNNGDVRTVTTAAVFNGSSTPSSAQADQNISLEQKADEGGMTPEVKQDSANAKPSKHESSSSHSCNHSAGIDKEKNEMALENSAANSMPVQQVQAENPSLKTPPGHGLSTDTLKSVVISEDKPSVNKFTKKSEQILKGSAKKHSNPDSGSNPPHFIEAILTDISSSVADDDIAEQATSKEKGEKSFFTGWMAPRLLFIYACLFGVIAVLSGVVVKKGY